MRTTLACLIALLPFIGRCADVNETNIPVAVIGAVTTNDYIRILTNCAVSLANGKTRLLKIGDLLSLVPPSTGGAQVWTNNATNFTLPLFGTNLDYFTYEGFFRVGRNVDDWGPTPRESIVSSRSFLKGDDYRNYLEIISLDDENFGYYSQCEFKAESDPNSPIAVMTVFAQATNSISYDITASADAGSGQSSLTMFDGSTECLGIRPSLTESLQSFYRAAYIFDTSSIFTNILVVVANNGTNLVSINAVGTVICPGTVYPSNATPSIPTAASLGAGGYWTGNSNGFLVTVYSIDGSTTVMKVLAP